MAEIIQPSFSSGELAGHLHGRVDLSRYRTALKLARNVYVHVGGGVMNRPGSQFIGEVSDSDVEHRCIPFQFNTEQTYMLVLGNLNLRVIREGAFVTEAAKTITGATQANPCELTVATHSYSTGDMVSVTGVGGMTQLNQRFFKIVSTGANTFTLQTPQGAAVDSSAYTAFTSGGSVARLYTVTTPWVEADLPLLKYTQSADTMTFTHTGYQTRELTRTGHAAWTLSTLSVAPAISAPTGVTATPTNVTAPQKTYNYKVTALDEDLKEESLPSSVGSTSTSRDLRDTAATPRPEITVTWTGVSGAGRYEVYKDNTGGLYGYIGSADSATFTDDNIAPDITVTPPEGRDPFASNNYPGVVTYFEGRRVFANLANDPQTIHTTQSGNFSNFNRSRPARDSDAVSFTINSRQVNEIRHMVPFPQLIVLTSGAEYIIDTGEEPLTPSSAEPRPQSYFGCSDVPPVLAGNSILYVQSSGRQVRDLRTDFEGGGYIGGDVTILANHLFEGRTVKEMAYAQIPDSLLWVVMTDGKMLSCTFVPEQQVVGWCRHDTDGTIESCSVIREGSDDVLYMAVRRTVNGTVCRFIERLATRQVDAIEDAVFMDSSLSYDGAAATTISGLWHLEGEEVTILADGSVEPAQTVTNGQITLATAAEKVHVGLAYTSEITTLPIEADPTQGSVRARRKAIHRVGVQVKDTRGLWAGPDASNLTEYKPRQDEDWGAPTRMRSEVLDLVIDPRWTQDGSLFIQQPDPLPLHILAVIPEVQIGGSG